MPISAVTAPKTFEFRYNCRRPTAPGGIEIAISVAINLIIKTATNMPQNACRSVLTCAEDFDFQIISHIIMDLTQRKKLIKLFN